jgi:hypothetical protein
VLLTSSVLEFFCNGFRKVKSSTGILPITIRAVNIADNIPDLGYLNENDVAGDLEELLDDVLLEEEQINDNNKSTNRQF